MPTLSIIVPIYNVEKYLTECVESICNQTYNDLEIILIDDGSTDLSGKICDEFAKKDERVVVIHKSNGGLSSARNAGIDVAKGEYIGFVDSDDYVAPQMYRELYESICENNADVSICGYMTVTEAGNPQISCSLKKEQLSGFEALRKLGIDGIGGPPFVIAVNKLYRKSLFSKIRFPNGKLHEDAFIMHEIFDNCSLISTVDRVLYFYRQRNDSITKQVYSVRHLDCVEAYYARYNYYKKREKEYLELLDPTGKQFANVYYQSRIAFNPSSEEEYSKVRETQKMARNIAIDRFFKWSTGLKIKLIAPKVLYTLSRIKRGFISQ